jgi:hypothetical protein
MPLELKQGRAMLHKDVTAWLVYQQQQMWCLHTCMHLMCVTLLIAQTASHHALMILGMMFGMGAD